MKKALYRYQVSTYRDNEDYIFREFAIGAAYFKILDIRRDQWISRYWWAKIYDRDSDLTMIIWYHPRKGYIRSPWFRLP